MMRVYPRYPGPATLRSGLHRQGIALIIGSVLFTVGGFWLVTQQDGESKLIGSMLVVVSGFMASFFLWQLARHRTGITLDADGFVDHTTLYAAPGRVHWSEVVAILAENRDIGVNEEHPSLGLNVHLDLVAVVVRDPDAVIDRAKPRSRKWLRKNYGHTSPDIPQTPVRINVIGLPISGPALATLMNEYFNAWQQTGTSPGE